MGKGWRSGNEARSAADVTCHVCCIRSVCHPIRSSSNSSGYVFFIEAVSVTRKDSDHLKALKKVSLFTFDRWNYIV